VAGPGRAGALLDIDGTLVDTNHLHVVAWCRAFRRTGHDVPMHRIHERIGMGGDDLVAELVGGPDPDVSEAWAEEFHHLRPEVRLLPGARDLIRTLHAHGQGVVLASSSPGGDVDFFRGLLDVDEWLDGATSSDDADEAKPEPDIFEAAMERFGLDPARTIAVGDAIWDARAAQRAEIAFVGLESGGTAARILRDEGAVHVVRDPAALVDLIGRVGVPGLRGEPTD
jgi:HAD superfamily hydrolase (TIGR01509 family)